MLDAISKDVKYKSTIEHARILHELNKKDEALEVLLSIKDTTEQVWQLVQKADMLLELKAYSEALELYNKINKIDSAFTNNQNIAKTLQKVGQTEFARKMLVSDTLTNWNKEVSLRNLLNHDLKYENGLST
jgi:tetratricopeptide (TPR) repeat protein